MSTDYATYKSKWKLEQSLKPQPTQEGNQNMSLKHTDANGNTKLIAHMDDSHLLNTIKLHLRNAKARLSLSQIASSRFAQSSGMAHEIETSATPAEIFTGLREVLAPYMLEAIVRKLNGIAPIANEMHEMFGYEERAEFMESLKQTQAQIAGHTTQTCLIVGCGGHLQDNDPLETRHAFDPETYVCLECDTPHSECENCRNLFTHGRDAVASDCPDCRSCYEPNS